MNSDSREPTESLITTAAAHGHRVTPVMLKKWRDAGIIPRPQQRSLGRDRGTVALYPAGTRAQLLRLLSIRAEASRFNVEHALWRLWWEGFPIEPTRIRALLEQQLGAFEGWVSRWHTLTPDERIEEITRISDPPPSRLPEPLRTIRTRLGSQGMGLLASSLARMAVGEFGEWLEQGEQDAVLAGLGLDQARRERIGREQPWLRGVLSDQLSRFTATIRPERLRDAVAMASDEELQRARDELKAFLKFLYTARVMLESITGREGAFGLARMPHPNELEHAVMPGMLLGWLAFRRDPALRSGYDTMMSFAAASAPVAFFMELVRKADTEALPRRLAPSGSMAHGEEPSTCTTSLSSSAPSPRETVSWS